MIIRKWLWKLGRPTSLGRAIAIVLPLVAAALFHVWAETTTVRLGYLLSQAGDAHRALLEENRGLRIEVAALRAPERLERMAKALSERLTYLMEPIRPIEIDADACVAQLRSSPPQRDDDGRSYYELTVRRGGEISLCRFRKEPGTPRQNIAANVTREVLLRLADDFEAVLS